MCCGQFQLVRNLGWSDTTLFKNPCQSTVVHANGPDGYRNVIAAGLIMRKQGSACAAAPLKARRSYRYIVATAGSRPTVFTTTTSAPMNGVVISYLQIFMNHLTYSVVSSLYPCMLFELLSKWFEVFVNNSLWCRYSVGLKQRAGWEGDIATDSTYSVRY